MADNINPDTLDKIIDSEDPADESDLENLFSSGFETVRGGEEKKEAPKVEEAQEAKPDDKVDDKPDDKPGEKPDEKLEVPESEKTDREKKLEERLRSMEGKYGTLNSKFISLDQKYKDLAESSRKEAKSEGVKTPTKEELKAALEDEQRLEKLKDDFPEYFDALEAQKRLFKAEIDQVLGQQSSEKETLKTELEAVRKELADEKRARQAEIVDEKHPGWQNVVASQNFKDWLNNQDDVTRELYESEYGRDVVKLLDKFQKESPAKKQEQQKQRLESNITPATRSPASRPAVESEEDAFSAGFRSVRA